MSFLINNYFHVYLLIYIINSYIFTNCFDFPILDLNNKELIELKRRCRADKIAGLSLSRITYLSIAHESEPDPEQALEAELLHTELLITPESSPDERMALQLGKKLAQVLGSSSASPTPTPPGSLAEANMMPVGVAAGSVAIATPRVDSPLGNGGELFNISKAKKVELQNLSSRFTAAVSPASTPTNLTDVGVAATGESPVLAFVHLFAHFTFTFRAESWRH